MTTNNQIEQLVSAGGVVYRMEQDVLDIAICGQHSQDVWSWRLPKGTPDTGETLEETAIREVMEETGLKVILEAPIDSIQYWFVRPDDGIRCQKTVHFYLMRAVGGSFDNHDHEFDEVRWSNASESLLTLTYRNEIDILDKAIEMVSHRTRRKDTSD